MTTENNNTNPETAVPVDQNQKAVANPATQTLFRFVSLRNPQLAKKEGNLKFIFRDDNVEETTFDQLAIQWNQNPNLAPSKIDYYIKKIISNPEWFQNRIKSEKHFKELYTDLYSIVKKFAMEGVESLSEDDLNDVRNTQPNMQYIWTTIIYQIVMQEDFYLKELMSQLLQLIHYVENQDYFSSETNAEKKKEKQKELATAKVVIPDFLFVDSATVPTVQQNRDFTVGTSAVGSNDAIKGANANRVQEQNVENSVAVDATYLPTESMLKRQKVALASYEKAQLEDLKKELSKAQSIYRKQYSKAFELASKDYQNLIKPLYDDYDQSLLEVEATFTEEMTAAAKKLALSQVVKPEVPEFQFEFRRERDVNFLQSKLSENSLRSFVNLIGEYSESETLSGRLNNGEVLQENIVAIGEDQFVLPEDENQNFDEMLETINVKLSDLNETIYQNTEVEKQEYVSIGGVLIPVTNNNESSTNVIIRDAEFCAYENIPNSGIINIGGRMSIHSSSTFSDISYNVSNGNVVVREGSYHNLLRTNEGVLEISDLFNNQLSMADFNQSNTFVMKCKIDGLNTTLTVDISNQGCNRTELISVPNNSTTNSSNNTFVPKGFGIKRLGIADYLKVEQTTHAYVEGEVASIENIMAREYREKSTRRLRRSEVTETTSSDTEREQLTDTTTASRFEMQSEIAKMQQEATDIGVNASTGYSGGGFNINVAASYANHRSKEESMRQAVTQAQDVTARALDRVVTKVHQERIEKIIEEFEENNSHGFDNRKGDKHVVGVYRWVDKLMKNQVWDYGKRLMFEFAIPQPAKLHLLAMSSRDKITKPIDPRNIEGDFNLGDFSKITDTTVKYWGGLYNVDIEEKPVDNKTLSWSHSFSKLDTNSMSESKNETLTIPEGYKAIDFNLAFTGRPYNTPNWGVAIGNKSITGSGSNENSHDLLPNVSDSISISAYFDRYWAGNLNAIINLELFDELKQQWQQKTFNAIIDAYENAMVEYNNKIAEEETKANNIKGSNPLFYRQIEQEVLKHNCIAYLTDDKSRTKNIGVKMYTGNQLLDFKVDRTDIDEYTSFAKFMELAFEWDIMSYSLYPYYWGDKAEWGSMYVSEDADPLFRSFLRSGMARVVVTVRPGFEDAVQFYMATGRLWNGGEVPVIGDPMYLSIVDELKNVKGEAQGKPWITRLPTSLTILQAQNIGLEVQHALPFTKEDPLDFENPEEVITESNFYPSDDQMEAEKGKLVENIEINNDYLQLTNNDNPHQVIAQLSLDDLKQALE